MGILWVLCDLRGGIANRKLVVGINLVLMEYNKVNHNIARDLPLSQKSVTVYHKMHGLSLNKNSNNSKQFDYQQSWDSSNGSAINYTFF